MPTPIDNPDTITTDTSIPKPPAQDPALPLNVAENFDEPATRPDSEQVELAQQQNEVTNRFGLGNALDVVV
jgi:hypothetical protein